MPRARTGTLTMSGDHLVGRVRMNDGKRVPVHFPPDMTRTEAALRMRRYSKQAQKGELHLSGGGGPSESSEEYCQRFIQSRTERGLASVHVDRSQLRTHAMWLIGKLPMSSVKQEHGRAIVSRLDDLVAADELAASTAENAWWITKKLFKEAVCSKREELRILKVNPFDGVEGPYHGVEKQKVYLYPTELVTLVASQDVPRLARQWYAVETFLYLRPGEIEVLACEDVDFAHNVVNVYQSIDWMTGELKAPKAGRSRVVPIEPAITPVLRARIREVGGHGPLFPELPFSTKPSEDLRDHLLRAGVTREALFTTDATRRKMRMYDLRATGVTWRAVRGDDSVKIQRSAGHRDLKTTLVYIRETEAITESFGEVFPVLAADLGDGVLPVMSPFAAPAREPVAPMNGLANGFLPVPPATQVGDFAGRNRAEAEGFEPSVGLPLQRLSKPPP